MCRSNIAKYTKRQVVHSFKLLQTYKENILTKHSKFVENRKFPINSKNGYDAIEITASSIVLKKNEVAKAIADWTAVASADFNSDKAYIVTHDGYLFIISSKDIKEGSIDELKQIAEEKLVKADD